MFRVDLFFILLDRVHGQSSPSYWKTLHQAVDTEEKEYNNDGFIYR